MSQKIIDKIRKLIRHERSARSIGNIAEAEAFAGTIQQLVSRYRIDLSTIDIDEQLASTAGEWSDSIRINYGFEKYFLGSICRLNGCTLVIGRRPSVMIVGTDVNREIAAEIYRYFVELGHHLADLDASRLKAESSYRRKRKKARFSLRARHSFLFGFCVQIIDRFEAERDQVETPFETGLIFIGRALADSKKWMAKNLETDRCKSSVKLRDPDAFVRGRIAGAGVALTTKTIV